MRRATSGVITLLVALLLGCATNLPQREAKGPEQWLAGDHHVHSQFSVGWDRSTSPPTPIVGGDAIHPIPMNVLMGKHFGLSWMVATDHGGPNHSKVNREQAFPELQRSRLVIPEVIQFYGMELNTPGGEHNSLIIPHTHDEVDVLAHLESQFDTQEAFPMDPARNTETKMLDALTVMRELPAPPVVIANHPSRTARGEGEYGLLQPAELRRWNDTAPEVAVGMAGAPGHQAAVFYSNQEGPQRIVNRGAYSGFPTLGGFDQMTARVGGFWDSMLGEGRHWWITANSDFHRHHTESGIDFWPGEYSKTYIYANKNHDAILAAFRAGKVFVTTGDLVSQVELSVADGGRSAAIGGELLVARGSQVEVTIKVRDPDGENANGDAPTVARVDLIVGSVDSNLDDPAAKANDSTQVIRRFSRDDWQRDGEYLSMTTLLDVDGAKYVRIRGTNTDALEPQQDVAGEDPWQDLWFYSNPVFVLTD
jgi:hypothetical protein